MKLSSKYDLLLGVFIAFGPSIGTAGEMKAAMIIDSSNLQLLQAKFATYGSRNRDIIFPGTDGIRFLLPDQVEGMGQTGLYSYFALAGDCEVIITYELLKLQTPRIGYGCGVGLAFDLAEGGGRGDIQRVYRVGNETGFALHSGVRAKKKDTDGFVSSTTSWGRIGLRRIKKELIFLAADEGGELQEIKRLPFTDETIRTLRLFADQGGSPTMVDVLVRQIEIRAEEITGGVAERDARTSAWWWLPAAIPACAALLLWRWRRRSVIDKSVPIS